MRGAVIGIGLALASCGGGGRELVEAPVAARVVQIPAPGEEVVEAAASAAPVSPCPPDTFAEHGRCVRVVASPEIPSWAPPSGHLDPCATWTSDEGVYDCDPRRETADGGAP